MNHPFLIKYIGFIHQALRHKGVEDRVQLLLHWQDTMLYARDSLLR
jgi:hypothetical protein